jgi:LysM repeat protein
MYNDIGLNLPFNKRALYFEKLNDIFPPPILYRDSVVYDSITGDSVFVDSIPYDNPAFLAKYKSEKISGAKGAAKGENGNTKIYYTIKSGDGLGLLADLFNCSISDLKKWNKLRGNTIVRGQKLVVVVPSSKATYYGRINGMSTSQKRKLANKD